MVSPGRRTRSTGVDIVWANQADRGIAKRPTQSAAAVIVRVICPPPSFNWSIRILSLPISTSVGMTVPRGAVSSSMMIRRPAAAIATKKESKNCD